MGKQKAIDDKMKMDDKFRQDIDNEQKHLSEVVKPKSLDFEKFVDHFYEVNKWKGQKVFGQEIKYDYQSESSFDLKNISSLVQNAAKAILEGGVTDLLSPPEPVDSAEREAAAASAKKVSMNLMVNAAVATISSVLNLFSYKAAGVVQEGMESHRIAPGLMLHAFAVTIKSNVSVSTSDGSLIMSAIGYKLVWCREQVEVEQDMHFMAFITAQLEDLESSLRVMQRDYNKKCRDLSVSVTDLNGYHARLELLQKDLAEYRTQVNGQHLKSATQLRLSRA
jgi:hypothetical protein